MPQENGYTGKILRVDLSTGEISDIATQDYTEMYVGGRGISLKIHWDEVPADVGALDPENRLVFMTGPIGGVPGFAGSRWMVSAKSPIENLWNFNNMGGAWGAQLKFAGYDGIVIQGKADALSYLYIEDGTIEIRDASDYKGKGTFDTIDGMSADLGKGFRVVCVGPAGENVAHYAIMVGDQDSTGCGGLGAVMGSKNLKAIAVHGTGKVNVADREKVKALRKAVKAVKTPAGNWNSMLGQDKTTKNICFGCVDGCIRQDYHPDKGRAGKYFCHGALFYEVRAQRHYGEITDVPYLANKLCDDYGVDSRAIEAVIFWLVRCSKSGTLTEEETGIPLTKIGGLEFFEAMIKKIAFREGIGDLLADGVHGAAGRLGKDSEKLITDYMVKTGETQTYGARLYVITALLYAFEPRMPIQQLHEVTTLMMPWLGWYMQDVAHKEGGPAPVSYMTPELIGKIAKRMWGDETCIDLSTYDKKGLAAAKIQDREQAKECVQLCDFVYPVMHSPHTPDHMGDPTLESQILSAVTGRTLDEQGLMDIGERVYNLQRAILTREGRRGRDDDMIEDFNFDTPLRSEWNNTDCFAPGKDGQPFPRVGLTIDRDGFEQMKDEFYAVRGWDVATGFQTRSKLADLGLEDVADWLAGQGYLA